jgi:flagellar biosynthetic protein FliR
VNISLDQFIAAAVFIGARVSGLMVFCPFLGGNTIPAPVKAVLTVLVTALLYAVRGPIRLEVGAWHWAGLVLTEVMIGLGLGLSANLMLEAPMLAGQVLGVQMGYSLAALFDPQTQADTPVLGQLHHLAALLIFLQLDVHHWLFRAVAQSFAYLPPGAVLSRATAESLLHAAGGIFLAGLQIATPALAATLVADVGLGFLGKASPQMPILFVSMAVKNLLGLAVMVTAIAYWPRVFSDRFAQCIHFSERVLQLSQ